MSARQIACILRVVLGVCTGQLHTRRRLMIDNHSQVTVRLSVSLSCLQQWSV
jgi:hypothetical protein